MLQYLALALIAALAAPVQARAESPVDADALCANQDVPLATRAQLRELVGKSAPMSDCSDRARLALILLERSVERSHEDLCSGQALEELEKLYDTYVSRANERRASMPKAATRLAVALGMQMSNACRRNMVRELVGSGGGGGGKASKLLSPEDFAQVEDLVRDKGLVTGLLSTALAHLPDEVFIPSDITTIMNSPSYKQSKIHLQAATEPHVRHLQAVCQRRFQPIYEPLLGRVNRLSNMGFSYRDAALKAQLREPSVAREVTRWSRIVFLCESLRGIQIVSASDSPADKGAVRVLTELEAKVWAAEQATGVEFAAPQPELPEVVYEPVGMISLGDVIYNTADDQLVRAVRNFKIGRSRKEVYFQRLTSMSWNMFKSSLATLKLGSLLSGAYKGLTFQRVASPSEQVVRSLDRLIAEQKIDPKA